MTRPSHVAFTTREPNMPAYLFISDIGVPGTMREDSTNTCDAYRPDFATRTMVAVYGRVPPQCIRQERGWFADTQTFQNVCVNICNIGAMQVGEFVGSEEENFEKWVQKVLRELGNQVTGGWSPVEG
jgi:hypothetical protein